MITNTKILKIKNSIILFLLLLLSCNNETKKSVIEKKYYYVHRSYYGADTSFYTAEKIIDTNDKRKIIKYIYHLNPQSRNNFTIKNSYYKIKPDGLILCSGVQDTVGSDYFLIKKDTCVTWTFPDKDMNDLLQLEQCYLGEEIIKIGKNNNVRVHKFLVKQGTDNTVIDGLTNYYTYYDNSFIFVKNEELGTGISYTERVDSIPVEFKMLLDSINQNNVK